MTYGAFTARDFNTRGSFDTVGAAATGRGRSGAIVGPQALPCAIALALAASAGLWFLYGQPPAGVTNTNVANTSLVTTEAARATGEAARATGEAARATGEAARATGEAARATGEAARATGAPDERPAMILPAATPPLRHHASLLDPALTSGFTPVTFARSAPLHVGFEPARPAASSLASAPSIIDATSVAPASPDPAGAPASERVAVATPAEPVPAPVLPLPAIATRDIPVPAPRPASFLPAYEAAVHAGAARRAAPPATTVATASAAPEDHRSFFDKLFTPAQPPSTVLAYASPEDGTVGNRPSGGFGGLLTGQSGPDRATAVYDIAAHTVTLPDGTKLEAHSGLGPSLDDPRSVTRHMRGATPPNIYALEPRAQLFHGVRALRLNPTGGTTYGRAGLLAHTFMLGPRGDSNGCVVFRNYGAFLAAYESGQVKRLAVVLGSR